MKFDYFSFLIFFFEVGVRLNDITCEEDALHYRILGIYTVDMMFTCERAVQVQRY